jgi:hypothetical protein
VLTEGAQQGFPGSLATINVLEKERSLKIDLGTGSSQLGIGKPDGRMALDGETGGEIGLRVESKLVGEREAIGRGIWDFASIQRVTVLKNQLDIRTIFRRWCDFFQGKVDDGLGGRGRRRWRWRWRWTMAARRACNKISEEQQGK